MRTNKKHRLIGLISFVLLPFGGLFLILNYLLQVNMACIIIAEIGLIFPMIMISNEFGLRRLYKHSKLLGSEVISSKKIKESDDDYEIYGDCYRTIVAFSHDGQSIEKPIYSESKIKRKFINVYYNPDTEELVSESDVKECENTRKSKALWIIGFVFFITAAIVGCWDRFGINVTTEQFSYGFGLIVSIGCIAMGIMMFGLSKEVKNTSKYRVITGSLIEYRLVDDTKAEVDEKNCYPVYQYYDNGEEKIYVANNAHKHQKPIGTKTKLYINKEKEIFEHNDINTGKWVNCAFIGIGLIGAVVCAISLFIGPIFI